MNLQDEINLMMKQMELGELKMNNPKIKLEYDCLMLMKGEPNIWEKIQRFSGDISSQKMRLSSTADFIFLCK